mmetsp:Transcript_17902/g.53903  ORF Transcript_17902/g.53903 Transcript_17902/m.53903 type:complete len:246 (+) Transcript_17902:275-1012(+)|eukprot:CAMPEP_0206136714 /NCGR_PEP_ID=MMETSP1473-20131121/1950_1 /ASSEMBLY_ACC=CAM_ASM_001109 /TAXON_ID=1461547 /ORGANISM="Stichococcus sp, Strain RCC1054" /LENGTH=245 /DNA_ID=CAMNT_0053529445 /DNA_START=204 /DNA_END=941 /DNA_ORIENTATION=+
MLSLPAASTASFQEHSVRKQLTKCHDIVGGRIDGRADLQQWQTSHVFRSYLSTLADDLQALRDVPGMQADVLEAYQRELDSLQQQRNQAASDAAAKQASQRAAAEHSANRRSLFADLKASQVPEEPQPKSPPRKLTAAERRTLDTNADLQDYATDEMVGMAAVLKGNSLAMEEQLRRRGRLLDETEGAMQHSLEQSRAAKTKATEFKSMQRVGFCKTCLSLLMVGGVFVGMYMYIRVTYMVGFKQ